MTDFNPRQQYQLFQKDSADELGKQASQRWMTVSLAYSMAQFAANGATESELAGVRRFIGVFINLHEKLERTAKYPVHTLHADQTSPLPEPEKE
jgi:hypothetical protein